METFVTNKNFAFQLRVLAHPARPIPENIEISDEEKKLYSKLRNSCILTAANDKMHFYPIGFKLSDGIRALAESEGLIISQGESGIYYFNW